MENKITMLPITSIKKLIESFDDAEPSEQAGVLKRIDMANSEFEKYNISKFQNFKDCNILKFESLQISKFENFKMSNFENFKL